MPHTNDKISLVERSTTNLKNNFAESHQAHPQNEEHAETTKNAKNEQVHLAIDELRTILVLTLPANCSSKTRVRSALTHGSARDAFGAHMMWAGGQVQALQRHSLRNQNSPKPARFFSLKPTLLTPIFFIDHQHPHLQQILFFPMM